MPLLKCRSLLSAAYHGLQLPMSQRLWHAPLLAALKRVCQISEVKRPCSARGNGWDCLQLCFGQSLLFGDWLCPQIGLGQHLQWLLRPGVIVFVPALLAKPANQKHVKLGLYSYGLYGYGLYSYGLYNYGLYSQCTYRYSPHNYGLPYVTMTIQAIIMWAIDICGHVHSHNYIGYTCIGHNSIGFNYVEHRYMCWYIYV